MSNYKRMRKMLDSIAPSRHRYDVFRDFVEIFALSIRNSVDRAGWQEREDRYLQVIKPYSRDELDQFAEVFALVTMELEAEPSDILGRLYMEMEISSDSMGQFFTPYDMAKLIAGLTVQDLVERVESSGFARLYEPACGAGAFLIASTQALRAQGISYQSQLHVTAEDLSVVSVHMAYIHLSLLHVPAVVHHRNTLTMETFDTWRTPAHVIGLWEYRLRASEDVPLPEPVAAADWDDVFAEAGA